MGDRSEIVNSSHAEDVDFHPSKGTKPLIPSVPVPQMTENDAFNWLVAVGSDETVSPRITAETLLKGLGYQDSNQFIVTVRIS